jgi:DNA invertase Pin-like site-specific DNA recombinase
MNVGYARTSTADQAAGLAAQERDLTAAGSPSVSPSCATATC